MPLQVYPAFKWNVLPAPAALSCLLEQARAPPQCAGARTHRMRRAPPRSCMSVLVRLCTAPCTTVRPPLLFPVAPPRAFSFSSLLCYVRRSCPTQHISFFLSSCFSWSAKCTHRLFSRKVEPYLPVLSCPVHADAARSVFFARCLWWEAIPSRDLRNCWRGKLPLKMPIRRCSWPDCACVAVRDRRGPWAAMLPVRLVALWLKSCFMSIR